MAKKKTIEKKETDFEYHIFLKLSNHHQDGVMFPEVWDYSNSYDTKEEAEENMSYTTEGDEELEYMVIKGTKLDVEPMPYFRQEYDIVEEK